MKVIIIGCGRVGSTLALRLQGEGHEVTIVDKNPISLERLNANPDIHMIVGTGIDIDILESAGIQEADVLIAVTNGDNTNIMIAQIAQFIYHVKKVMARIVDPKVKKFYEEEIGLTCYCHTQVNVDYYHDQIMGV